MPNADELPDALDLGNRIAAGMNASGYGVHGGKLRFAKQHGVKPPVVNGWLSGRHRPTPAKVRRMALEFKCDGEWLYWGKGTAPAWWLGEAPKAKPTYTPERRADDDVTALKIAVQSLLKTLAEKVPGSAQAFLDDQKAFAEELSFPLEAGTMLDLEGIAKSIRADEAKRDRNERRRGSGGGKKL